MDSGRRAALQHAEHGLNNTTRKKGKTFQHVRKNRKKPPCRRRQTECKVSFKVQRVKGAFLKNVGNQKEMAVFAAVKNSRRRRNASPWKEEGKSALTAGSGCVVQRPPRVEVAPISTPAFGRRGAMDCAWEANTRLSLPMFGHRGAMAAILHFHVDSPPVSAFGGRALARTSFEWRGFLGAGGRGE